MSLNLLPNSFIKTKYDLTNDGHELRFVCTYFGTIFSCAALDDVEMIEAWRTAGADLNVGDYDSRTALHVVNIIL